MRRKPGCHDEVTATINSGFNEGLKSPRRSQQSNSAKFSNLEFPLRTPPKSKIAKTNIEVQLRRGADIKPLPIHWLWRGWIACGKLSLLAGNAGTGKTTLALAIASVITRGGLFPDGSPCERAGNVLIWSGEDVADDTLVPRLIASGADMHRCFFIEGVNKNGESIPFDPAMHIATLHDVCVKIGGASLMIVDPIVSAVSGDMYRPNDVRRSLQAIVDFAEIHQCAVIGITHFTKGSAGASPLDRILGSQAFVGLARLALVAAKEESGSRRILARAKSNIGKDMGGIAYSLNTTYIAPEIEVSHVVWGEAIEGSAREILNDVENVIGEDEFKRDAAKDFLRNKLRNGAIQVNQLKNEAGEANLKWRTVERAKSDLGVKANKAGLDGGWFWTLPAP
ncbi:MAG: AAA family ATPase [Burkholderiales bacterium]|nr:AAA family ATPase [Burkholderiales bacterium]